MKKVRIGDIFEIPLPDGRRAYGQYVFKDKMGPLIQVFDLITPIEISIEQLKNAGPLFPPVFTGLFAAIRTGLWKVIGQLPVATFSYQKFISTMYFSDTNQVGTWYLWDGERYTPIGRKLPKEYKHLEQLIVWDPNNLARRIETGKNPEDFILEL
jgi:hypothetical protein